nr:MAG TPA: hypothetical protein [Caudoviricetes sp.]
MDFVEHGLLEQHQLSDNNNIIDIKRQLLTK